MIVKNNENRIIGTWIYDYFGTETDILFHSNGDCIFPEYQQGDAKLTWKIIDTQLILMIFDDHFSHPMVFDYSFYNDGKTLTITGGEGTSMILNKQK